MARKAVGTEFNEMAQKELEAYLASSTSSAIRLGNRLGGGAYGGVFEFNEGNHRYAVKIAAATMTFPGGDLADRGIRTAALFAEMGSMVFIQSIAKQADDEGQLFVGKHTVKYYGLRLVEFNVPFRNPKPKGAYGPGIQMEYFPGTLLALMKNLNSKRSREGSGASEWFPTYGTLYIAEQIMASLAALNAMGMLHLDIKPDNIFVRKNGDIVVGDYGMVHRRPEEQEERPEALPIAAYNINYRPPEILSLKRGEKPCYSEKADSWAAGVVIFVLMAERNPFQNDSREQDIAEQNKKQLRKVNDVMTSWSKGGSDAAQRRMNIAMTLHGIGKVVMSAKLIEIVEMLLRENPERRASAAEVLAVFERNAGEGKPWVEKEVADIVKKRKPS